MALKTVLGKKILEEVIRGCSQNKSDAAQSPRAVPWKVLVVDHVTMRIISSVCKVHEIAYEGILLVEAIYQSRERFPFRDAIYLLSPSEDSINALIKDFQDPAKPTYRDIHVFFTEVCPEGLFNKLGASRCASRIHTLKELEFSCIPYESQVFTLDSPDTFKMYYSDPALSAENLQLERMGEQIASLCASLGEYPYIRYSVFGNVEKNARLAQLVQRNLDVYKQDHVKNMGQSPEQARSQLIILDRSFDCVSPLLHELTFQAMAYDLVDIQNDLYKIKGPNQGDPEREVTLDESNDLWRELRHKNIGVATQQISRELKAFTAAKKGISGDASKMKDLTKMIREMPQYQKDLRKYNTNFRLAEDCVKEQERILLLCKIEQDLAMGTNEHGEPIKDYMTILNPVLLDSFAGITELEKLRVILLYILNQNGISEEKLNKLLQHGNIESTRKTIMNLDKLGINVTNESRNQGRVTQVPRTHKLTETYNVLSRWTPTVKEIMEDIIEDKLDRRNFPFLEGRIPAAGQKGHAVSARYGHWHLEKNQQSAVSVPRLLVFIIGGITFSEMRSAYEVTESGKNWEVVIGSTHTIVPNSFLKQLEDLS